MEFHLIIVISLCDISLWRVLDATGANKSSQTDTNLDSELTHLMTLVHTTERTQFTAAPYEWSRNIVHSSFGVWLRYLHSIDGCIAFVGSPHSLIKNALPKYKRLFYLFVRHNICLQHTYIHTYIATYIELLLWKENPNTNTRHQFTTSSAMVRTPCTWSFA